MIAVDSSVLISGILAWHEFHDRAAEALEQALARKRLLVPLPALVESYAVITRLPSGLRLPAKTAHQLLQASFGKVHVAALPPEKVWPFLNDSQALGMTGGRVYDALIATIAIEAGARSLLTFNPRYFDAFSDRLRITIP